MQIKLSYDAAIVLRVLEYETVTLSLRSSTHLSRATYASCTVASHTLNASGANSIHIDLQATATGTYWQIFEWSASNEHVVTVYINSKILISISSTLNHLKTNQSSRSLCASELKVPGLFTARLIFKAVMITKQVKLSQRKASLA